MIKKRSIFLLLMLMAVVVAEAQEKPFIGKTIAVIGDSYVRNHRRPMEETWHARVAERLGMNYRNYGRNGNSIAFDRTKEGFGKSMLERYREMTDSADFVLVIAGHNDAFMIGHSSDSLRLFRQRLDSLCIGLRQKYPQAAIGFVTPWAVERTGFAEVTQTIREVCANHHFPVLDATRTSGILPMDTIFRKKYFQGINDTAHLNAEGHALLLDWGERFLRTMVENGKDGSTGSVRPELTTKAPQGRNFVIGQGGRVDVVCDTMGVKPVVKSALKMFASDCKAVLNAETSIHAEGNIVLRQDPSINSGQVRRKESFRLDVKDGKLYVTGGDAQGLAYGLLEVSRLMGVSPWEWWADATPEKRTTFTLPDGFHMEQSPSVEYRGIFINDEDWGLMPWAGASSRKGVIGPAVNERIFQLLLRLRANTYWPAMHECTEPFFLTPGNREMAERYGIYIGSSHCEPMVSNAAGEWLRRGKGDYDYVNNSENVYRFWEERVKAVAGQPILYTIGIRGVHDGAMQGAKTVEEQKRVLERVFKDQRRLIEQYVKPDVAQVPQVFIPYKEVLDIYDAGLQVPEDVCLMWCDDNYGYIRHFPTTEERQRKGGNGIYYHISYWGRPHDYLWLGTLSPALLYQQMTTAYDQGIQRIWILNVGDIKPAEYQIELFMDMAWNLSSVRQKGWTKHLGQFLEREFGRKLSKRLQNVMQEHYRLAHIRKPELMGGTRVEEADRTYWSTIRDLPWSEQFIDQRLAAYQQLEDAVELLSKKIAQSRKDEYFQLVKYPVQAAAEMNKKLLYAQKARCGRCEWAKSDAAFDSIQSLTQIYNTGISNQGKWQGIMDCQPRRLAVFGPVEHTVANSPMHEAPTLIAHWNGTDCTSGDYAPCEGLGYEGKAVKIVKGTRITFEMKRCSVDSVEVEVMLLPTHPIEGKTIRILVSFDDQQGPPTDYATRGRSEEWKENVLNNQAVRRFHFAVRTQKKHRVTIEAIDDGVVLDQINIIGI